MWFPVAGTMLMLWVGLSWRVTEAEYLVGRLPALIQWHVEQCCWGAFLKKLSSKVSLFGQSSLPLPTSSDQQHWGEKTDFPLSNHHFQVREDLWERLRQLVPSSIRQQDKSRPHVCRALWIIPGSCLADLYKTCVLVEAWETTERARWSYIFKPIRYMTRMFC